MPYSHADHILYTRNEYTNMKYYKDMFKFLETKQIVSYIDVGANVGEVCNIFFERFSSLKKAYLFEPEINNFSLLKENIKNLKNVELFNLAIYYGNDQPCIFQNFNPGGNIISNKQPTHGDFKNAGNITNFATLESLNIPMVDLMKIDIEGGEFELIEKSTYIHDVNYLEIEFHNNGSYDILNYISSKLPNHKICVAEDILGRFLLEKIK